MYVLTAAPVFTPERYGTYGDIVEQSRSKEKVGVRRFDLEGFRQSHH